CLPSYQTQQRSFRVFWRVSWATDRCSFRSIHFALAQDLPVSLARVFIILLGLLHLVGFDEALLLRPALIHAFQTPLGAAFRGAHRLFTHLHPNRVRVRRRQDAHSHPTAPFDLRIEYQVTQDAVGDNLLVRHRVTIHDELDRH